MRTRTPFRYLWPDSRAGAFRLLRDLLQRRKAKPASRIVEAPQQRLQHVQIFGCQQTVMFALLGALLKRLSRNARLDLEFRQADGICGETHFLLEPSMWTPETRTGHDRDHLRYGGDLSDEEWRVLAPFLPPPAHTGRRRCELIGIGGCLSASPLPHHRAYGSVPRRFDRVKLGNKRLLSEGRSSRNRRFAVLVVRLGVRTYARNRLGNRPQPQRRTLARHAGVVL